MFAVNMPQELQQTDLEPSTQKCPKDLESSNWRTAHPLTPIGYLLRVYAWTRSPGGARYVPHSPAIAQLRRAPCVQPYLSGSTISTRSTPSYRPSLMASEAPSEAVNLNVEIGN
jgi:hypothetical protein